MKIGIDLGGSHIGIGVVDENGNIIEKFETDLLDKKKEDIEKFIKKYISVTVDNLIKKYDDIQLIGIASPGTPKNGKITTLVNLGVKELDIEKVLKDICNIPIKIQNDAKCAAIAEKMYGNLKKYDDAIFLCLGTGIGGAVFINNEMLTPKRNPGLELGHMIIKKDGEICNCGKQGCFETYCSIKRLKDKLINMLGLPKDTTPQELIEILKLKSEEENIKDIIEEYIDNLIIGLSNIIDIFEPQAIALGGSFVYFKDVIYDKLCEKYYNKRYVFNKDNMPELKLAKLKNDSGIIGASRL